MVVRTTSWREGVLLGRPRVLPDRSRIYARIDALPYYTFCWSVGNELFNHDRRISCPFLPLVVTQKLPVSTLVIAEGRI